MIPLNSDPVFSESILVKDKFQRAFKNIGTCWILHLTVSARSHLKGLPLKTLGKYVLNDWKQIVTSFEGFIEVLRVDAYSKLPVWFL